MNSSRDFQKILCRLHCIGETAPGETVVGRSSQPRKVNAERPDSRRPAFTLALRPSEARECRRSPAAEGVIGRLPQRGRRLDAKERIEVRVRPRAPAARTKKERQPLDLRDGDAMVPRQSRREAP